MLRKLALAVVIGGAAYFSLSQPGRLTDGDALSGADRTLSSAFDSGRSGFQIEGRGEVVRILSDDLDGDRHQRFILRLQSGQTLLIAHNIDIAPRITGLGSGDTVAFNGEYEWNPEGGVIHWTHHDPGGRHTAGWLKHGGRTYQ
jgi:hypothetical protein